jgi:hypothetical protein
VGNIVSKQGFYPPVGNIFRVLSLELTCTFLVHTIWVLMDEAEFSPLPHFDE